MWLKGQHHHLCNIQGEEVEKNPSCVKTWWKPGGEGDKAVYQCSAQRGYLHKPRGT